MKICENPPHIDAVVKNERETVSDLPDENVKLNAQPQVTPHIAWACLCYGDDDERVHGGPGVPGCDDRRECGAVV